MQSGNDSGAVNALLNLMKSGAKTPDTMDAALALVRIYLGINNLADAA